MYNREIITILKRNKITYDIVKGRVKVRENAVFDKIGQCQANMFSGVDFYENVFFECDFKPTSSMFQNCNIGKSLVFSELTKIVANMLNGCNVRFDVVFSKLTSICGNGINLLNVGGSIIFNCISILNENNILGCEVGGDIYIKNYKKINKSKFQKPKKGYNPKRAYLYFDNSLFHVFSIKEISKTKIYETSFGFIVQEQIKITKENGRFGYLINYGFLYSKKPL